jgi:hypothetical protein
MISLKGMYDLHIHASPSIVRRKFTALEALKLASGEGMAGILLVDHAYNTESMAQALNELGYGARIFGTILLNEAVGGLNPSVVEAALGLGTKQIQMPTYSSRNHEEKFGGNQKNFPYKTRTKGIYILDDRGRLIPEVEEILELLKGSGSFLGTGHLSAGEMEVLIHRAETLKVRVIVNGASNESTGLSISAQKKMAGDYVFMEHDYGVLVRVSEKRTPIESVVEQIREAGAERCVIATDAGQMGFPDPISCLREFLKQLMEKGITEREIDLMTRGNPRFLLGIS